MGAKGKFIQMLFLAAVFFVCYFVFVVAHRTVRAAAVLLRGDLVTHNICVMLALKNRGIGALHMRWWGRRVLCTKCAQDCTRTLYAVGYIVRGPTTLNAYNSKLFV